jgi:hypothetical protein
LPVLAVSGSPPSSNQPRQYAREWIVRIEDITGIVRSRHQELLARVRTAAAVEQMRQAGVKIENSADVMRR